MVAKNAMKTKRMWRNSVDHWGNDEIVIPTNEWPLIVSKCAHSLGIAPHTLEPLKWPTPPPIIFAPTLALLDNLQTPGNM